MTKAKHLISRKVQKLQLLWRWKKQRKQKGMLMHYKLYWERRQHNMFKKQKQLYLKLKQLWIKQKPRKRQGLRQKSLKKQLQKL